MAVTSDPYAAADLAARIPEVWTPLLLEQLFPKTVAANWFTDLSSFAANGGDILHVAGLFTNNFTAQDQSTQGAEVTTESVAQTDITLTIATHKYVSYIIGDLDRAQLLKSFDFSSTYAAKAGGTLRNALEASLFGLWSGLSTNAVGDTATVLTDLEIRQGINALDGAEFPIDECAFFFHPTVYWLQVLAIQKYYDASMRGQTANNGLTLTGNFGPMDWSVGLRGSLYNLPVFVSTNVVSGLATYRNLLAHKTAFGFAVQTPGGNKVRVQAENALRNIGMLTVSDIMYGVVELRDAAAALLNANTTATAS